MRILITSGPTREYLDPVRFLSNASSGQMGRALAAAALERGGEVVLVSGPVETDYPGELEVHRILTTEEMLKECLRLFPGCDAVIGAAAPCDYRPKTYSETKLSKSAFGGMLELVETPDILAALGKIKRPNQRIVAFALETDNAREKALAKLRKKNADFIVLNDPTVIGSPEAAVEILDPGGTMVEGLRGDKTEIARRIVGLLSF